MPQTIRAQLLTKLQHDPTFGSYFQSLNLSPAPLGSSPPAGFDFPILTDPADCAFQLIEGKNPTLFTFTAPTFNAPADAEVEAGLGPFSVFMSGSIDVNIGLSIGYDTNGLRTFLSDPRQLASDLLDGFFIDDGIDPRDRVSAIGDHPHGRHRGRSRGTRRDSEG